LVRHRLDAWNSYEAIKWAQAHIERGLPMSELPKSYDYCLGMHVRITALLEAAINFRAIPRKAEPAALPAPS
jgi:hypothetical protein